ncbi:MAG: hypothetical protein R3B51_09800 [Thermodesulfobacteriota bacterium]
MAKGRTTKTTTKKTAAAAKPAKKKSGLGLEYILYSKKNKVAYVTINRPRCVTPSTRRSGKSSLLP